MALARFEGANKKRAALWDIANMQSMKHLIINPNGDCYLTNRFLGKGATKIVYSGKLEPFHSREQNNAVGIPEAEYPLAISVFSQSGEEELQKELQPLEALKNIDGIIKVKYSDLAINNGDASVPILITQKYNTIDTYLETDSSYPTPLTKNEKIELIKSLTNIVFQVHTMGKIHRDIKEVNILIDKTTKPPKPILIDFESCIDANDKSGRKKEPAGTNAYLAPEYASAIKKLGDATDQTLVSEATQSLVHATTRSVDIWALGLVLFRIYYGESFLYQINKIIRYGTEEQILSFISNISQDKINKVFEEYEKDPIAQIIKNMLAVDPLQRKMPEPADWPNETA